MKCGAMMPDDAGFCSKCGSPMKPVSSIAAAERPAPSPAASGQVTQLKCPGCGAPISPKFGEAVISCGYCGGSVTLGREGWSAVQKHTMLQARLTEREQVLQKVRDVMDRGMFHKHIQEKSRLEEATLGVVPYWLIPASASTTVTFMWGETGGAQYGDIGGQVVNKTAEVDDNYDFPVVAVKALKAEYQPKGYQFALADRQLFDFSKLPKGLKVINGDVGEEQAKFEAKTLVKELQYTKAHDLHKHHTIERIATEVDVTDGELLHAPIWYVRYDHDGKKIVLVVDANSGGVMSTSGL